MKLSRRYFCRTLLAVLFVSTFVLGLAQGEDGEIEDPDAVHDLKQQVLCLDSSSVVIQLEGMPAQRGAAAKISMAKGLAAMVQAQLKAAQIPTTLARSCQGKDGYVMLQARVIGLNPQVYRHFAPQSFGYTLSLQVGIFANSRYMLRNHVLPGLRFINFVEDSYAESGQGAQPFERYLLTQAQPSITKLIQSWQEDNQP